MWLSPQLTHRTVGRVSRRYRGLPQVSASRQASVVPSFQGRDSQRRTSLLSDTGTGGHGLYSLSSDVTTACPPNSCLNAANTLSPKESSTRDLNLAKRDKAMTGAGTPRSTAC